MPIKEFKCRACGHRFEELVWLKEPDPKACPKCGKEELTQVLGTFRVAGVSKKSAKPDEGGTDEGGEFGGDDGESGDFGGGDDFGAGGDFGGDGGDLGDAGDDAGSDAGGDAGDLED